MPPPLPDDDEVTLRGDLPPGRGPLDRSAPRAAAGRSSTRIPRLRWLALLTLALGEYLVLALLVDGSVVARRVAAIGVAPRAVGFTLAIAAAVVVLGRSAIREGWTELGLAVPPLRSVLPHLVAHIASYGAFAAITLHVFSAGFARAGDPRPWLVGWLLAALVTALSLVTVALPLSALRALLWRVRRTMLMALALGALAWAAAMATNHLWMPMSRFTLHLSAFLLRLTGVEVFADPSTQRLGTPDFVVEIAPECSGLEGLGLTLALVLGWLAWRRNELRFPRALLVPLVGAAVAILGNGFRIAALVAVGDAISPALAVGAFHSRAGWIVFCAVSLGLIAAAERLQFFWRTEPHQPPEAGWDNPTAVWVGPLLAASATALVTGLFSTGFESFYVLRILAAILVLWSVRSARSGPPRIEFSLGAPLAGLAVFPLYLVLPGASDAQASAEIATGLAALPAAARVAWIASRTFGGILVIPLIEEMAFRGFLLRRIIAADFTAVDGRRFSLPAVVLSSLAFGAVEQHLVAGTLAGLVFAATQLRRGRLWDAVIAHATANALIAATVLLRGQWGLWR